MVIISRKILTDFGEIHPQAIEPLNTWYVHVLNAQWRSGAELRQDFPSADFVGDNRWVFNIKGNHFRLIGMVFFNVRTLYIRFIGTHAEYDEIKDIKTI
jgi:mRNA interferase HigB